MNSEREGVILYENQETSAFHPAVCCDAFGFDAERTRSRVYAAERKHRKSMFPVWKAPVGFLQQGLEKRETERPRRLSYENRRGLPGGLEGIRTLDPHNANVVRSQLRYKPISRSMLL